MVDVLWNLGPRRPEKPEQAVVDRIVGAVETIDPTLDVEIYSGRFPKGHPFGSPRHGTGNTVDFRIKRNGKTVPHTDPVHVQVFGELPNWGLNELGVGMGGGGIHAGFGTPNRPPAMWGYPGGKKSQLKKFPEHVKAVQQTLGVQPDGVYGRQTIAALTEVNDRGPFHSGPPEAQALVGGPKQDQIADLITQARTSPDFTTGLLPSSERFLEPDDIDALARITWAEARGEEELGQKAVAEVVLNRAFGTKDFPDSVAAVIEDKKHAVQFSPMENRASWRDLPSPPAEFRQMIADHAESYLNGSVEPIARGAVSFSVGGTDIQARGRFKIGDHNFGFGPKGGKRIEVNELDVGGARTIISQAPHFADPGQFASGERAQDYAAFDVTPADTRLAEIASERSGAPVSPEQVAQTTLMKREASLGAPAPAALRPRVHEPSVVSDVERPEVAAPLPNRTELANEIEQGVIDAARAQNLSASRMRDVREEAAAIKNAVIQSPADMAVAQVIENARGTGRSPLTLNAIKTGLREQLPAAGINIEQSVDANIQRVYGGHTVQGDFPAPTGPVPLDSIAQQRMAARNDVVAIAQAEARDALGVRSTPMADAAAQSTTLPPRAKPYIPTVAGRPEVAGDIRPGYQPRITARPAQLGTLPPQFNPASGGPAQRFANAPETVASGPFPARPAPAIPPNLRHYDSGMPDALDRQIAENERVFAKLTRPRSYFEDIEPSRRPLPRDIGPLPFERARVKASRPPVGGSVGLESVQYSDMPRSEPKAPPRTSPKQDFAPRPWADRPREGAFSWTGSGTETEARRQLDLAVQRNRAERKEADQAQRFAGVSPPVRGPEPKVPAWQRMGGFMEGVPTVDLLTDAAVQNEAARQLQLAPAVEPFVVPPKPVDVKKRVEKQKPVKAPVRQPVRSEPLQPLLTQIAPSPRMVQGMNGPLMGSNGPIQMGPAAPTRGIRTIGGYDFTYDR